MKINPYLLFNGKCEAAFRFYERCLGGKLMPMHTYGASPMAAKTPPEFHNRILHATLMVGDQVLMGSDGPPEDLGDAQGFSVSLNFNDTAEAERIFQALSENATVKMPLQKTFWAERFGMLVDQFGTPWMVNCEGRAQSEAQSGKAQ